MEPWDRWYVIDTSRGCYGITKYVTTTEHGIVTYLNPWPDVVFETRADAWKYIEMRGFGDE
jgi:hypothetical protein